MTCLYHINFSQIVPSFHLHHCRCRSDLHHRPHRGSVCRTPRGDDRPAPRGVPCPSKSEELQQNINCPFYMVENYDFRIWTTASKKCGVDWLNATAVSSNFVFGPQTLQQASARDCQRLQNPRTMSIPS